MVDCRLNTNGGNNYYIEELSEPEKSYAIPLHERENTE